MRIVNIDTEPLEQYYPSDEGYVFAGHAKQIVGVNFNGTKAEADEKGIPIEYYRTPSEITSAMNDHVLESIWINQSQDNTKFSILLTKSVIPRFMEQGSRLIGNGDFFVVCDDRVLQSQNPETNKIYFRVKSEEQLMSDFKIWPLP